MLFSIQGSTARKYQTEFGWHVSAEQMRLMLLKILRSCWSEKQFKSANIDLIGEPYLGRVFCHYKLMKNKLRTNTFANGFYKALII